MTEIGSVFRQAGDADGDGPTKHSAGTDTETGRLVRLGGGRYLGAVWMRDEGLGLGPLREEARLTND
jgi:hypothetical protein